MICPIDLQKLAYQVSEQHVLTNGLIGQTTPSWSSNYIHLIGFATDGLLMIWQVEQVKGLGQGMASCVVKLSRMSKFGH